MAEEKLTFFDRLGPTLTSGLIIAFLSATSLGAISIRDLVVTTDVDITYLKSDIESVKSELEKFKQPGGRFTAADGARHDERLKALETFAEQCRDAKTRLEVEVEHLKQEVELSRRHTDGDTPRSNPSSNRSRN